MAINVLVKRPSAHIACMNELIDLYESWNKPEKAEQWRAKMLQTEAVNE